eukprot:16441611-Heterocapsa_arctica.AAC.1
MATLWSRLSSRRARVQEVCIARTISRARARSATSSAGAFARPAKYSPIMRGHSPLSSVGASAAFLANVVVVGVGRSGALKHDHLPGGSSDRTRRRSASRA